MLTEKEHKTHFDVFWVANPTISLGMKTIEQNLNHAQVGEIAVSNIIGIVHVMCLSSWSEGGVQGIADIVKEQQQVDK